MSSFIKNIGTGISAAVGSASVTITLSSGVTAGQGNILVAVGYGNAAGVSVSSVTDSQSNTYIHDFTSAGNAGNQGLEFWRCLNPAALTSGVDTITANTSGGTNTKGISIIADLYVHLGAPDITNSNFVSVANVANAISVTPVASDVIAIASCAFNDQETSISMTTFTLAAQQNNGGLTGKITQATAYLDSPGTSLVTATFTGSNAHTSVSVAVTYGLAVSLTPVNTRQAVKRAAYY